MHVNRGGNWAVMGAFVYTELSPSGGRDLLLSLLIPSGGGGMSLAPLVCSVLSGGASVGQCPSSGIFMTHLESWLVADQALR